jgi:hypothetical protein
MNLPLWLNAAAGTPSERVGPNLVPKRPFDIEVGRSIRLKPDAPARIGAYIAPISLK